MGLDGRGDPHVSEVLKVPGVVFAGVVAREVGGGYIGDCSFIDSHDLNMLVARRRCRIN